MRRQLLSGLQKDVPIERSRSGIVMPPKGGSPLDNEAVPEVAAYVWAISRKGD